MLRVEDLSFSYGNQKVLHDVTFDAEGGQLISILGPNGVGKTTLMKCICNIIKADTGKVEVDGKNVSSMGGRELSKHIAFVPQTVPTTHMTVYDTVLLGRKPYVEISVSKKDIDITSRVVYEMGLGHLAFKYADQISGGEYQKVQIARAIVQEPSVMMLDEPTNNLDISNQHKTMEMISNIVAAKGMCAIMTMHDINLSAYYSDKLMFVKDGRIVAYGGRDIVTPELVKEVYCMDVDVIDHDGVPMIAPSKPCPGHAKHNHLMDHPHPHSALEHIMGEREDCA